MKKCNVCEQYKVEEDYPCRKSTGTPVGGKCKVCYASHVKMKRQSSSSKPVQYKSRTTEREKNIICQLYQEDNLSATYLAEKFGQTRQAILALLKRRGINIRNSVDQAKISVARLEVVVKQSKNEKRRGYKEKILQRNRKHIENVLHKSKCMDCGCNNWVVLEFDHRDPLLKSENVSRLMHYASTASLQEEIEKCDIVCANCHAMRTAKMFGSWRIDNDS